MGGVTSLIMFIMAKLYNAKDKLNSKTYYEDFPS